MRGFACRRGYSLCCHVDDVLVKKSMEAGTITVIITTVDETCYSKLLVVMGINIAH